MHARPPLSHIQLLVTPWTVALQAPLSLEFSRQEYWSGLPFPSPGDLPEPRIKPAFLMFTSLQEDSSPTEPSGKPFAKFQFSLVAQSCLTLCNPTDCSLPGSSVHGVFQARILEWVAVSHSRGSSLPRDGTLCLWHWQADSSLCHLGSLH